MDELRLQQLADAIVRCVQCRAELAHSVTIAAAKCPSGRRVKAVARSPNCVVDFLLGTGWLLGVYRQEEHQSQGRGEVLGTQGAPQRL